MAEKEAKRQREETQTSSQDFQHQKRHTSFYQTPHSSLPFTQQLEQENLVLTQDVLSSLLTTPDQDPFDPFHKPDPESAILHSQTVESVTADCCPNVVDVVQNEEEEEDEKEKVIRHLLEASDDELGLPSNLECNSSSSSPVDVLCSPFYFCDGLWELEDEAANYSTLLQAQLFM